MVTLAFAVLLALPSPMLVMGHGAPTLAAEETKAVCPVCGSPIEAGKGMHVTVRGRDYIVDGQRCSEALATNPDQYLDPDGMPKNGKKTPMAH